MDARDPWSIGNIIVYLLGSIFAVIGGVAKQASLWQVGRANFTVSEVLAQSVISWFAGVVVALYLAELGYSEKTVLIGAGLAGFVGATLLYAVGNKVLQALDPKNEFLQPKSKSRNKSTRGEK